MAEHHGVSTDFVIKALAKLGVNAPSASANVAPSNAKRFVEEWGSRIAQSKPPPPPVEAEEVVVPVQAKSGLRFRQPPPEHVIRVAYVHIDSRRNMQTMQRVEVLSANPGPAHAIDPMGTWTGDPWLSSRRGPFTGDHSFYSHPGPPAACGAQVRVVLKSSFTAETPDPCPKCAAIVEEGRAFRNTPGGRPPSHCEEYMRISRDGVVSVEDCVQRWGHSGRHRSSSKATWADGGTEYKLGPVVEG